MEQCEKTVPRLLKRPTALKTPEFVYVCMSCGRRSYDRRGTRKVHSGWGTSCIRAAVRFPSVALQLDARGIVTGIQESAVTRVRAASLASAS